MVKLAYTVCTGLLLLIISFSFSSSVLASPTGLVFSGANPLTLTGLSTHPQTLEGYIMIGNPQGVEDPHVLKIKPTIPFALSEFFDITFDPETAVLGKEQRVNIKIGVDTIKTPPIGIYNFNFSATLMTQDISPTGSGGAVGASHTQYITIHIVETLGAVCSLELFSDPEYSSEIYLNGQHYGQTPKYLGSLNPGEYEITLIPSNGFTVVKWSNGLTGNPIRVILKSGNTQLIATLKSGESSVTVPDNETPDENIGSKESTSSGFFSNMFNTPRGLLMVSLIFISISAVIIFDHRQRKKEASDIIEFEA